MNSIRLFALTAALALALGTCAVSVKTDRTWYLAGEAMTVGITDGDALIAYAELCDTYGLAAGVVVGLRAGAGEGVIQLPADLHSGFYVLSAYTRHNATVAQQLVAVVNLLRKSEDDDIRWVGIEDPDSLSYPLAAPSAPLPPSPAHSTGEREAEGHIITARIRNVYGGHTFSAAQIRPSLSIVGKQIHYFEGRMTDDSTAVFYTYGIHGRQPLVLTAMSYTGVSLPVEMVSPFAALVPKKLPPLVFHYRRSEVEARSLGMQRHLLAIAPAKQELHLGEQADDDAEEGVPLDYDATLFGGRPDFTYNLDEYRQFHTVREVLFEYVSFVKKKKINGVPKLIVFKEQESYNGSWPALVLIDGMPVIDIERLLGYDARRIHYINIYSGRYTFGNGVHNGILSFISRSGRLTNYPTESNVQYLVYQFP